MIGLKNWLRNAAASVIVTWGGYGFAGDPDQSKGALLSTRGSG
jgi:hypothetical protein